MWCGELYFNDGLVATWCASSQWVCVQCACAVDVNDVSVPPLVITLLDSYLLTMHRQAQLEELWWSREHLPFVWCSHVMWYITYPHLSSFVTACKLGWRWLSDWQIDTTHSPDGWMYNSNFANYIKANSGTPKKSMQHFVRRKRLVRDAMFDGR